jgi:hypothetical protein
MLCKADVLESLTLVGFLIDSKTQMKHVKTLPDPKSRINEEVTIVANCYNLNEITVRSIHQKKLVPF